MKQNPWQEINLRDYEKHMCLPSVMQAQALNQEMQEQFACYPFDTVMILGVAGGNGLEYVSAKQKTVFGVDINQDYLNVCQTRFPSLSGILVPICADLTQPDVLLPHAKLMIANLFIEYIGVSCFQRIIEEVKPQIVSCVIQCNHGNAFVSDSPYAEAMADLDTIHHNIDGQSLSQRMAVVHYQPILKKDLPLPNDKSFQRFDYEVR